MWLSGCSTYQGPQQPHASSKRLSFNMMHELWILAFVLAYLRTWFGVFHDETEIDKALQTQGVISTEINFVSLPCMGLECFLHDSVAVPDFHWQQYYLESLKSRSQYSKHRYRAPWERSERPHAPAWVEKRCAHAVTLVWQQIDAEMQKLRVSGHYWAVELFQYSFSSLFKCILQTCLEN